MPKATTYQCPNCNGVLEFDTASGHLTCEYCGHTFEEGEFERELPIDGEAVEAGETTHVKTVDEFLEAAPWRVASEGYANAVTYSCPSCGAGVVADQSTVSTACPYCGNNMLVQGIATSDNVPRYVMPFTVTKDDAEARMREHFQHKWYLSRAFDASLEHMQGVYVPYHLYDINVSGWANYVGYEATTDGEGNTDKSYCAIRRAGHASFKKIPIDGSSKMPDAHMDAIAPFDFGKLRDFSASYVAGYLTEVPDEDVMACYPRAEQRARKKFENDLRADAKSERDVNGIEEVVAHETQVVPVGGTSCVLPVWLAHCAWEGNQMLFAVNGDTGRCVGDLPIDGKRRAMTIAITALVVALLAFAGSFVLLDKGSNITGYVIGAVIGIVVITLLVDAHFKGQMRTAVEATGAGMSYDDEGLVVTERWCSKFYLRKSKARSQFDKN